VPCGLEFIYEFDYINIFKLNFVVFYMSDKSRNLENKVVKENQKVGEYSLKDKIALPYVGFLLFGGISFIASLNYYNRINSSVLTITGTAAVIGAGLGYVAHRLIQKYIVERKS